MTSPSQSAAGSAPGPHTPTDIPMRAVVQDRYGSASVLRLAQVPRPRPAADEVLVQVQAAGLDRGAWHLMTGRPYLLRLAFGLRRPRRAVLGIDVAGTVVALGADVTRFSTGDAVYGMGVATYAEYAVVKESKLAHRPPNLTAEQASVVPVSGVTALQGLLDVGRLRAGQRVLITGASGGVGSYAVQLARATGAEVTGVCSTGKADLVRSLGADHVIDYTREDFAAGGPGYDLILDLAGNPSLSRLRRALSPTGTAVIAGGEEGGPVTGGLGRQLRAVALSPVVSQRLTMHAARERATDLERLTPYLESGRVTPALDRTYPLEQLPDAMRYLEAGSARGKVAITV